MRKVHQVIEHEQIIGAQMHHRMLMRPDAGIVVVGIADDLRGIGFFRVTHPHPYEGVALDHRIGSHLRARRHLMVPRYEDTLSRRVESQAVISALDAARDHLAQGERRAAMAASILKRGDRARSIAKQHHRLAEDPARERALCDFVRPCRDIPGVANKHWSQRSPVGAQTKLLTMVIIFRPQTFRSLPGSVNRNSPRSTEAAATRRSVRIRRCCYDPLSIVETNASGYRKPNAYLQDQCGALVGNGTSSGSGMLRKRDGVE
jgi:hypothetical protein